MLTRPLIHPNSFVNHPCFPQNLKPPTNGKGLTENGIGWIQGNLVLRGVSDQSLGVGEGNVAGRGPVSLIVGDDFDFSVHEDADAAVGRAQVDTDGRSFRHFSKENEKFS